MVRDLEQQYDEFVRGQANNLLTQAAKWRAADVSANAGGDMDAALGRITAATTLVAFTGDLFFPPEDIRADAERIPGAKFRETGTVWGHFTMFNLREQDTAAIDAVYVATPHQLHADHVELCARHGKHVLVEKPMALTLAECDRMIAAAERARVALVVGPTHSFDPPVRAARDLIASGRLGSPSGSSSTRPAGITTATPRPTSTRSPTRSGTSGGSRSATGGG